MISFFRHHLQGRFLRYIVYLVSFFVVFPYSITTFMDFFHLGGRTGAISVNGYNVGFGEYEYRAREIEEQIEHFKRMFGDKADQLMALQGLTEDPKVLAKNSLIMQTLLGSTARQMNMFVSPQYVNFSFMQSIPKDYVTADGKLNQALIEHATHKTIDQLKHEHQRHLLENLITQCTVGALYVPQFVLKDVYMRTYVPHTFLIAQFSRAQVHAQLAKQQTPTAQELQEFFAAQNRASKKYVVPERRSGIAWTFDADHYGITITDNQVNRYYESKKLTDYVATPAQIQVRQIFMACNDANRPDVRSKINQVYQDVLKNPASFEQKAREVSPFFSRGAHEAAFDQAAFRLTEDGAISPILETNKGFYILQRVARKPATYKPISSVRDSIVHTLRTRQFAASFPHMIRQITAQENKEQALATFAAERGAKKQVLTDVALSDAPVVQKLFATRKDGVSASVNEQDHGIVVFTTDIHKAYESPFESVKTRVTDDWYHVRAQQALKKVLHEADAITSVEQFRTFAQRHGGHLEQTGALVVHNQEQLKKLKEKLGEGVERAFAMSAVGSVAVFLGPQDGFAVCLTAVAPFNEADFQAHSAELVATAVQEQQVNISRGFVASLCKTATIKVHEKLGQ